MFDLILTVSVVVVSAFALGVAIYNIIDTRKKYPPKLYSGEKRGVWQINTTRATVRSIPHSSRSLIG